MSDMDEFYASLEKDRAGSKTLHNRSLSRVKYEALVSRVLQAKTNSANSNAKPDPLLARYDVMFENGEGKLIAPLKNGDCRVRYFVHDDELFYVLSDIHQTLGHSGRDKMILKIKKTYVNINRRVIQVFLRTCSICVRKQGLIAKDKIVADTISFTESVKHIKVRGHVHVLNFKNKPDGEYNYVMVYINLETNFVALRALQSDIAAEIADNLIDIFTMVGAPYILETSEKRTYTEDIIDSLAKLWPELKILSGKATHLKYEIDKVSAMIYAWMRDNASDHWRHGIRIVQFLKNSFLPADHKPAFEVMYRTKINMGLTSKVIPASQLNKIKTEEELMELLSRSSSKSSPPSSEIIEVAEEPMEMEDEIFVDESGEDEGETIIGHSPKEEEEEEDVVIIND